MSDQYFKGGCHCDNIVFEMELTGKPDSINPRACDCDFCSKHGAAYISDNKGKLVIWINKESHLSRYHQGSGIVDFLVCKICGVLVGACYEVQGNIYAAINSKSVERYAEFAQEIVVSPENMSDDEKTKRWKNIWFSNVNIKSVDV